MNETDKIKKLANEVKLWMIAGVIIIVFSAIYTFFKTIEQDREIEKLQIQINTIIGLREKP